jgi:hypothetical protein
MRKKYFAWTYGVARKPCPEIWWDEMDDTYGAVRKSVIVSRELTGEDIGLSLNELAAKYLAPKRPEE